MAIRHLSKEELTGQERAFLSKFVDQEEEKKPTEINPTQSDPQEPAASPEKKTDIIKLPPKGEGLPVMYTLPDLVQILGVSYKTAHKYVQTGKIKGVKIGNSWRVTGENLDKFLKGE